MAKDFDSKQAATEYTAAKRAYQSKCADLLIDLTADCKADMDKYSQIALRAYGPTAELDDVDADDLVEYAIRSLENTFKDQGYEKENRPTNTTRGPGNL